MTFRTVQQRDHALRIRHVDGLEEYVMGLAEKRRRLRHQTKLLKQHIRGSPTSLRWRDPVRPLLPLPMRFRFQTFKNNDPIPPSGEGYRSVFPCSPVHPLFPISSLHTLHSILYPFLLLKTHFHEVRQIEAIPVPPVSLVFCFSHILITHERRRYGSKSPSHVELRRRTAPEEMKEETKEEVKSVEEKAVPPPVREYRPSATDPSYRVEKDPRCRFADSAHDPQIAACSSF